MAKYTITPWRTQADLLEVRKQLYPLDEENEDLRRHAVDRVMAWKLRGNLPHAVESTALLTDAILHHDSNANSLFSIRAVYSAAFCRFVTGFCDIGRYKERSLEPSSMLEIAKQIDMPAEFVALRHEATHEELPGIQRLVDATQQAFDWLWRMYWSRLEDLNEPAAGSIPSTELKNQIAETLRSFRRSRRNILRSKTSNLADHSQEITQTCEALADTCPASQPNLVADVLVAERLLLPTNRELGSSLEGAFLIWDKLLHELSDRLYRFWSSLEMYLLESLSRSESVDPCRNSEKEAVAMWILHLLDTKHDERKISVETVVKWCCLHPGYWAQWLGERVLQDADEDLKSNWEDLFRASLTSVPADGATTAGDAAPIDGEIGERASVMNEQIGSGNLEAVHTAQSWTRAILPASVPIGVVK